jgi:hypothetical protein
MNIETTDKKININRMVSTQKKKLLIEEDIIIPDIKPDILKTIGTSGNVCISKKEAQEGRVKLDGYINVNIIYVADSENDNIRGINSNIDFKEIVECKEATSKMNVSENTSIKSIECTILNERKISIKIELMVEIILFNNEEISLVNGIRNISDLQTITNVIKINSMIGANSTKTYAKETVKIDTSDDFVEVLRTGINIINKEVKISYNKILAKAEAEVKFLYLTEDNQIRRVEEKIPVMGFIEMPNISEEDICDTKYTIQNIIIKPNSQEEHSIYVEIELEIMCSAFKEEEIEIIEDLYSPSRNLKYTATEIQTMIDKKTKNDVYQIKEKIKIPELVGEKLYDVRLTPNILNSRISNGNIKYEGEINADFIISSNNGTTIDVISKKFQMFYEMDFDEVSENSKIETYIEVAMMDSVIENDEITVNSNLNFEVSQYKEINIIAIKEVLEDDEECYENPYSMTIYFVKKGDTLWKIAKKYKSTIDEITKLNELKNKNNLEIGQQLFIPKYVCIQE